VPLIHGLTGRRWPAHPHRMADELLSCWIVRTAYANHLKLQSFTTLALGNEAALWNRDIDRSATHTLLERLSDQTGSTADDLRGGMLASYESLLFERHNPNGNTKWILPLGVYHRKRKSYGVQFCPLCLFFDPVPYYRRRWRLAFSTVCDVHGTMLHDRCPQCKAPVVYFRNDLGYRSGYRLGDLVSCWKCDFDLRRAPVYSPSGPDGKSISALRSLGTFHDLGWWFQGGQSISFSPLYFEALHHLLMVLPSALGSRLLEYIEGQTGWRGSFDEVGKRSPFESQQISIRHRLLVSALWLLEDWPERFVRAATAAGLSQSRIVRGESLPFWFESEIRLNLGAGFPAPTEEEAMEAAAYLVKCGEKVSGCAVGRLIRSRNSKAVKAYSQGTPAPMADVEFRCAIGRLDEEIQKKRPNSSRRLILQRDRTILILMRLTGWSMHYLLTLTVGDAVRIASTRKSKRQFPRQVAGVLLTYLRDTRRHLARESGDNALFINLKGSVLTEKGWSCRLLKYRAGETSSLLTKSSPNGK
jgi:hypothetical protein